MTYAADRADAAVSLAEDGQVMTLTYVGDGTYDPSTGATSGTAPDPEQVAGVILPLSPFRKSGNSNIIEGDQQCLLAAENVTGAAIAAPQVNGTLTDANAKVWTITAAEPLSPAGTDVLHDLVIRRAA